MRIMAMLEWLVLSLTILPSVQAFLSQSLPRPAPSCLVVVLKMNPKGEANTTTDVMMMVPTPPAVQPNLTLLVSVVVSNTTAVETTTNATVTSEATHSPAVPPVLNQTLQNNTSNNITSTTNDASTNNKLTVTSAPANNATTNATKIVFANATNTFSRSPNLRNNATQQLEALRVDYKALLEKQKQQQQDFQWQLLQLEKKLQDSQAMFKDSQKSTQQQMATQKQTAQENLLQAQGDYEIQLTDIEKHWINRMRAVQDEMDSLQTDLAQERLERTETQQLVASLQRQLETSVESTSKMLQEKDKLLSLYVESEKRLQRQLVERESQLAQSQSMVRNLQQQLQNVIDEMEHLKTKLPNETSPPEQEKSVRKLLRQTWALVKSRIVKRLARKSESEE